MLGMVLNRLGVGDRKEEIIERDNTEIHEGRVISLDLSGLGIETVPTVFDELSDLIYLDLSNNEIYDFSPTTFAYLDKLTNLNLSNNNITRLNSGIFKGLSNLKVLNFSNNDIEEIDDDVFEDIDHLDSLDLSNNNIEYLPDSLETLNVEEFNPSNNPLKFS